MDTDELRRDTELLDAELPDRRFRDESYLAWLYHRNPLGTAYAASVDDDGGQRVAHYALVPQRYHDRAHEGRWAFSLNAVTRSGTQRKGHFTTLSRRLFDQAAADGVQVVVGVSNENSTPPVVEKLGWRLYCPLPVTVVPRLPRRSTGWRSVDVDDAYLQSEQFAADVADVDAAPARGWANRAAPEYLRWRLASPNGPGFSVHVGPDLVVVSTRSSFGPLAVTVVLKLLARPGSEAQLTATDAVATACAHHRSVAAVYAGWNHRVAVRGIRAPRRLLPSPLNLIVKSLDDAIDQDSLVLATYEFLDMDAY